MPRCLLQSMAPKHAALKGLKLIHGYTPLIGPEAWLSTMGKRWMSSASTFVFYPLAHPRIRTFAFYHRPSMHAHQRWLLHVLVCYYLRLNISSNCYICLEQFAGFSRTSQSLQVFHSRQKNELFARTCSCSD